MIALPNHVQLRLIIAILRHVLRTAAGAKNAGDGHGGVEEGDVHASGLVCTERGGQDFFNRHGFMGIRWVNGFVREFASAGFETVKFLDGAAVHALGLGLVTEVELPGFGLSDQALEADGEAEVAILGLGDLDIGR